MLTEKLITISDRLRQTGVFGHVFPLARTVSTVEDGQLRMFPAAIGTDGELHHVLHDSLQGVVYFRISGDVTPAVRRLQLTSCSDDLSDLVYPVKQVVCVRKDLIHCQTDEQVMLWMIGQTIEPGMVFQSATLDAIRVLSGEYSNYRELVDINYRYAYVSIDWLVYISANVNCICQ
jgi:hypothetical protein